LIYMKNDCSGHSEDIVLKNRIILNECDKLFRTK